MGIIALPRNSAVRMVLNKTELASAASATWTFSSSPTKRMRNSCCRGDVPHRDAAASQRRASLSHSPIRSRRRCREERSGPKGSLGYHPPPPQSTATAITIIPPAAPEPAVAPGAAQSGGAGQGSGSLLSMD